MKNTIRIIEVLEIDKKHGSNAKKHNRYLGKRLNKFGKYPFGIKNSIAKNIAEYIPKIDGSPISPKDLKKLGTKLSPEYK